MLASIGLLLTCFLVQTYSNQIELVLVMEVAKIHLQDDGKMEIAAHISMEWNSTSSRPPVLLIDQLLKEEKSLEREEGLSSGAHRLRYFSQISVLCNNPDYSSYPRDAHICQLQFSSTLNSSRLLFLPHLVESPIRKSEAWKTEGSKAFVQWLQSGDNNYEIVNSSVESFKVFKIRPFSNSTYNDKLAPIPLYLGRTAATSMEITGYIYIYAQSRQLGGWIVLIQAMICCQLALAAPTCVTWPTAVSSLFGFFVFSVVSSILATLTPSLVLHLHLVPFEAHPAPCDVPIPSEHISLDSERTRFSAILDSARVDSSRTPRSANIELCMAELKYTLASLNETMNAKSTAAWRKRLWSTGYGRVETALAVLLHGANVCLLLFTLH